MKYIILSIVSCLVFLGFLFPSSEVLAASESPVMCEIKPVYSKKGMSASASFKWNPKWIYIAGDYSWRIFDVLTKYVPLASDTRDVYEYVTCTDLGTGRKLSTDERSMTGMFILYGGVSAASVRQVLFFNDQLTRITNKAIANDIVNKWASHVRDVKLLKYHYDKHVIQEKLHWTFEEYTDKATKFWDKYGKVSGKREVRINDGKEIGWRIDEEGFFGIYNKKGGIVTFGLK